MRESEPHSSPIRKESGSMSLTYRSERCLPPVSSEGISPQQLSPVPIYTARRMPISSLFDIAVFQPVTCFPIQPESRDCARLYTVNTGGRGFSNCTKEVGTVGGPKMLRIV